MRTSLVLLLALCGLPAWSNVPPPPAEMEAAHQVLYAAGSRDWRLDTAVFIDLSPVTATEPAIQLPEDQRDEPPEPVPSPGAQ
jgi:hypothetical protein